MNASIRNVFTNPLTVQEQLREADISRLRLALRVQEIAAALHKPVSAVTADDDFDFDAADLVEGARCSLWLRHYRAMRPAPEPEWPAEPCDLLTEGMV